MQKPKNPSDYLTPKQAADLLGLSTDSIYRYLHARPRIFKAVQYVTPGGHWWILRASVVDYQQTGKTWPEPKVGE